MASKVQGDLGFNQPYITAESREALVRKRDNAGGSDQITLVLNDEIAHPEHKPRRCLVGTSVLVFRENNGHRYILLGPRDGSHGKGTLAPPGGHIETCEYFEKTSRREVAEETGLEIKDVRRMTCTDDIFFIRDEANGEELQETKNINDIKHYETNFLGAVLLDDDKFEPFLMEPKKCQKWLWIRVDHVKRIFDESPEGALRREHDQTDFTPYGEDSEFDSLVKEIKEITGKAPKLFLPLTNLWLQKGADYDLYKEYQNATPESIIIRPAAELALINIWKNELTKGAGSEMVKRALEAQQKEIEALAAKLKKVLELFNSEQESQQK